MKRVFSLIIALSLLATYCFAQPARNPAYNHEGKSNFATVSTQGLDVTGNPGYLEVRSVTHQGGNPTPNRTETWYIWVDTTGDLCMSSYATISAYSSFPTGNWTTGMPCTVVGGQS